MVRCQICTGAVFDRTWSRAALSQCGLGPVGDLRQTSVLIVLEERSSDAPESGQRRAGAASPVLVQS